MLPAAALALALGIFYPVFAAAQPRRKQPVDKANASTALPGINTPGPQAANPGASLTLSPGVIMLRAQPGQSTTQAMTIFNLTPTDFEFELEAMDVAVREGQRVFVRAGELPGSIARTAVFSPNTVAVRAGDSATVQITVTVPKAPACRAVVAVFRSKTQIRSRGGFAMTASMGTLLTFTLSKKFQIESSGLHFDDALEGGDLVISEWLTNTGSEPVIPKGVVAVLNSGGNLVGKVSVEAMRLLPGERLQFKAEYPSSLKRGKYRALISMEHEGGVLTTSSEFAIQ
jgi:hypothetical protein